MLQCQSVSPWLIVTVFYVMLCGRCPTLGEPCTSIPGQPDPGCACQTQSGFKLDLSKLHCPNKDNHPCFVNIQDPDKPTTTYSYDPCQPIGIKDCEDAMICQTEADKHYQVGKKNTAVFSGDLELDSQLVVKYKGDQDRIAEIDIQCSDKTELKSLGEHPQGSKNYTFILKTHEVCTSGADKGGLSTGSILCILLFVFVAVYLVGGLVFLYFARGARGVEMIPNYEFWKELPSLVKDGTLFTVNGCKTDRTYEQI